MGLNHTIRVTNRAESVLLQDVAFGEVFLCSGQSNMELTVGGTDANMIDYKPYHSQIRYENPTLTLK